MLRWALGTSPNSHQAIPIFNTYPSDSIGYAWLTGTRDKPTIQTTTLNPYAVSAYHSEGTATSCMARFARLASPASKGPLTRVAAFSHNCANALRSTPHNRKEKSVSFMSDSRQPCNGRRQSPGRESLCADIRPRAADRRTRPHRSWRSSGLRTPPRWPPGVLARHSTRNPTHHGIGRGAAYAANMVRSSPDIDQRYTRQSADVCRAAPQPPGPSPSALAVWPHRR